MAHYLVDTNVLLRMLQPESAQRASAIQAVADLAINGHLLYITPQVLIEFWAVSTRPIAVNGFAWSPEDAATQISDILDRFPLLEDNPSIFQHWMGLVAANGVTGKQVHDARLVAVMRSHDVSMLLTFNTDDFARYQDIAAVHPDAV